MKDNGWFQSYMNEFDRYVWNRCKIFLVGIQFHRSRSWIFLNWKQIWLRQRSGEDHFSHSARVDAMLVKADCIASPSSLLCSMADACSVVIWGGCRLAGPCLRRFGQHTAISLLCSYFGQPMICCALCRCCVSIRATSTPEFWPQILLGMQIICFSVDKSGLNQIRISRWQSKNLI